MSKATVIRDNAAARYLEGLYILDGRDDREHPDHASYGGLYQARPEHATMEWIEDQFGSRITDRLGIPCYPLKQPPESDETTA